MTINERVKAIRKHERVDLTMEEFGARIGVTRGAISNIETGNRAVTSQMKTAIIREFHVNPEWLEEEIGEMFVDSGKDRRNRIELLLADITNAPDDSYIARMAEALSYLDIEDWRNLCQIAEKMAEAFKKEKN